MNIRRGVSLAVLLPLLTAAAGAGTQSGLDVRVDVSVRHAPLPQVLENLSAQARLNFILTDGLEDREVTAFLHQVTVQEVLDILKELTGVGFRRLAQSNSFLVAATGNPALDRPALADPGPALEQRITIDIKEAPLDHFFETLAAQTKASFTLDQSIASNRVTAQLSNVTAAEALEIILAMKRLNCARRRGREIYAIGPARL